MKKNMNAEYVVRRDSPLTSDEFLKEYKHGSTTQNTFTCAKGDTDKFLSDNTFYMIKTRDNKTLFEFIVIEGYGCTFCFLRCDTDTGFQYERLTDYHHLYANYIIEAYNADKELYQYKHYISRKLTTTEKTLLNKIKYDKNSKVYYATKNIKF